MGFIAAASHNILRSEEIVCVGGGYFESRVGAFSGMQAVVASGLFLTEEGKSATIV